MVVGLVIIGLTVVYIGLRIARRVIEYKNQQAIEQLADQLYGDKRRLG